MSAKTAELQHESEEDQYLEVIRNLSLKVSELQKALETSDEVGLVLSLQMSKTILNQRIQLRQLNDNIWRKKQALRKLRDENKELRDLVRKLEGEEKAIH